MLTAYSNRSDVFVASTDIDDDPLWIDLLAPTESEVQLIRDVFGIGVPKREDMSEIEASSRLYLEDGAAFMTAIVPAAAQTDRPLLEPMTFILTPKRIVTLRYHEPKSIDVYLEQSKRTRTAAGTPAETLAGLLEAIVDRMADSLERIGREIESVSTMIFSDTGHRSRRPKAFSQTLQQLGRKGDAASGVQLALVSLRRLVDFACGARLTEMFDPEIQNRMTTINHDIGSLLEYADSLNEKTNYLLSASLGIITMEQNVIIKLFSVVAVVFLPPTLIASIYGMNFAHMPELQQPWAYPAVLVAMALSAVLPILVFWKMKWL